MKNASRHAATLKSLHKKLVRQHKAPDRPQTDPLRAIVMGVLMEDCDGVQPVRAASAFDAEFVDVNELRVATELELADLLGMRYPKVAERSVRLRDLLMSLFDSEGRLTVHRLAALPRREQRLALRAMPQMTPFVEGYVALVGFGQAAVPVDESMRAYLVAQNALEPETTLEEAQRFLEAHLKSEECWAFFFACHAEAGRPQSKGGAKGSAKATTPKATPKRAAKPKAAAAPAAKRAPKRTTRQSA